MLQRGWPSLNRCNKHSLVKQKNCVRCCPSRHKSTVLRGIADLTCGCRSKKRIWVKGEESGNFLKLVKIKVDCDKDAILITANPQGPTCHTGTDSCWGEMNQSHYGFLTELEEIITERKKTNDDNSYVASLFREGINKIAQKVGEEAVETVIEAKDENSELFLNESADLLFHFLILLKAKGFSLNDVEAVLKNRKH